MGPERQGSRRGVVVYVGFAMSVFVGLFLCLVGLVAHEAFVRNRKTDVSDAETVPAGRVALVNDHCFTIPIDLPQGPTCLPLHFERDARGHVRFTHSQGAARIVHQDDTGVLVHVSGRWSPFSYLAFVYVVDPSTGRPSLLRVPPGMKRARQAVAWTFGMAEEAWTPLCET